MRVENNKSLGSSAVARECILWGLVQDCRATTIREGCAMVEAIEQSDTLQLDLTTNSNEHHHVVDVVVVRHRNEPSD